MEERVIFDNDEKVIMHYGMLERSGRFAWGSGENPYQRLKEFRGYYYRLKREGMDDATIAKGLGMSEEQLKDELISTGQRRQMATIRKAKSTVENVAMAWELKNKGYSNVAIGERMGLSEGTIRNLLKPGADAKAKEMLSVGEAFKKACDEKGPIDCGKDVNRYLGISKTKMDACVKLLEDEGYHIYTAKVDQLGTGEKTTIRALCPPDMDYPTFKEAFSKDPSVVKGIGYYKDDVDNTLKAVGKPVSISRNRIFVRYDDDPSISGSERDGVIQIRPGVEDLDLLGSKYAQVRIAVDDKMYMKGMAIYTNDIPDGYDVVYNVNKKSGTPDAKVFKPMYAKGEDNPFGANTSVKTVDEDTGEIVYQKTYIGKDGKQHQSALNIVNDEGSWGEWSKSISSQILSKQSSQLAKKQLGIVSKSKQDELDEIMSLNNPTIKKKLLEEFADGCDSDAVHLKAAAFPRQASQVIIPVPELKDTEIYAPNFRDGEKVVLFRHPHGGTFEAVELAVNNKSKAAKDILGDNSPTGKGRRSIDAVGINKSVADQLSGADFDGDSVIVIPNNDGAVKTSPRLEQLKNFDPKISFKLPEDAKILDPNSKAYRTESQRTSTKNLEMGKVSNLITDMTIKGASRDELARAVAHSMVVIDSVKHDLDYKASEKFFNIQELRDKYQDGGGASTIVSRAKAEQRIPDRKMIYSRNMMTDEEKKSYDRGEYVYRETGKTKKAKVNGEWVETTEKVTIKSTQMAEAKDARALSSGRVIEELYAEHANTLKSLALTARAEARKTPRLEQSPSAKKVYAAEVESLKEKLDTAERNRPLERQAQLIANGQVKAQMVTHPELKEDNDQRKKIETKALNFARVQLGANKKSVQVQITDKEWEAIQAGAISDNMLQQILNNTDVDEVRRRATPRAESGLSSSQVTRIKTMASNGLSQADIADALGISTSTVNRYLK